MTYLTAHKEPALLRRRAAVGGLELKRQKAKVKVTGWPVQSVALSRELWKHLVLGA